MKTNIHQGIRILLLIIGSCVITSTVQAQSAQDDKVMMDAVMDTDTKIVRVKWLPTDFDAWRQGISYGYRLSRLTLRIDGISLPNEEMAASEVMIGDFFPLQESEWASFVDNSNLAGIASGTIYEDSIVMLNVAGSNIHTVMNINTEKENRFNFFQLAVNNSFEVAKQAGLAYEEIAESSTHEYVYKVVQLASETMTSCVVKTNILDVLPEISNLQGNPGDKVAELVWPFKKEYAFYEVEKSEGDDTHFQPIQAGPILNTDNKGLVFITDSLRMNDEKTFFRVRGVSPFDYKGAWSPIVMVQGVDSPDDVQIRITEITETTNGGELLIKWEPILGQASVIHHYDLLVSPDYEGEYTEVEGGLPSSQLNYVHSDPLAVGYYKVIGTDSKGFKHASVPSLAQLNDLDPPQPPANLSAVCDLRGVVEITWHPNTEPDLMGYKLYMSNQRDGNYTEITTTYYQDTVYRYQINLNTLSEQVYIVARAGDFRENLSDYSSPFALLRPDIVPPSPPVITDAAAHGYGVAFKWILSSSADAMYYRLERKAENTPDWESVLDFEKGNPVLQFVDSLTGPQPWFHYRLMVKDRAGNESGTKTVRIKPVYNGRRSPLKDVRHDWASGIDAPEFMLYWEYQDAPDLIGFQLYRSIDSSDIRLYEFVSLAEAQQMGGRVTPFNANHTVGGWYEDISFLQNLPPIPISYNLPVGNNPNLVLTQGSQTLPTTGNGILVVPQGIKNNVPSATTSLGHRLGYQVMARYEDGGWSPVTVYYEVVVSN